EARARHREIAKPTFDERDDLVAPRLGLDEARVLIVEVEELLLVVLQLEEIRRLFEALRRAIRVERTNVAGEQFLLGLELLAADAIPALMLAEVDVAVLRDALPDLLHELFVTRLRRSD